MTARIIPIRPKERARKLTAEDWPEFFGVMEKDMAVIARRTFRKRIAVIVACAIIGGLAGFYSMPAPAHHYEMEGR